MGFFCALFTLLIYIYTPYNRFICDFEKFAVFDTYMPPRGKQRFALRATGMMMVQCLDSGLGCNGVLYQ